MLANAHNPSLLAADWLTAACYLSAAGLAGWALWIARVGVRMSRAYPGVERRAHDRTRAYRASVFFWSLLLGLLLILAWSAHVDLVERATALGRRVADAGGWYAERRTYQGPLLAALAILGAVALAVALRLTRVLLPRHVLAFVGVAFIVAIMLARLASFHHVDAVLAWRGAGAPLHFVLESAGIFAVAWCAILNTWWYRLPLFRVS